MTEEQKVMPESGGLAEVDSLLAELDPGFNSQLGEITTDLGTIAPVTGLESISLSADLLKESAEGKAEEIISAPLAAPIPEAPAREDVKELPFLLILKNLLQETIILLPKLGLRLFELAKEMKAGNPLTVLRGAPDTLLPLFAAWLVPTGSLFKKLSTYSLATYLKLVVIVCLIFAIRLVFNDMRNHTRPDGERDPFLKSWAEVADSTRQLPDTEDEIDNPMRHPEYTVLIHRIIANLRPPNKRSTPMVTSELYIEASNQDCAIEIHEREQEVRDALARVFEDTTFDDLDTKAGKERLKVKIRSALNKFITKGHIKRVFFSSLNISP